MSFPGYREKILLSPSPREGKSCWKGWQEISAQAKNFVSPKEKGL